MKVVATQMTNELLESKPEFINLPREDILSMLLSIFAMADLGIADPYYVLAVRADYEDEAERDCIAIGYFGEHGGYSPCLHHGRPLHPTGDDVQIRRVHNSTMAGSFSELIEYHGDERVVRSMVTTDCDTYYDANESPSCNIWMHIACWNHLQDWLDCPLPPRIGRHGKPLTFAGELYELVASRHERQAHVRASLPCIDYGGTLGAFTTQYQDDILGCRVGVEHLARALKEGLRDEQLIPAILEDCGWWKFVRPDRWPRARHPGPYDPNPVSGMFESGTVPQLRAKVCQLPNELLPELLQHCHLQDIFALASTCKDLYTRILDRNTLHYVVRNAISNVSSPLRWIAPVRGHREQWMAAYDAMKTWMTPAPPTFAEVEFPEDEVDDEDYIPPEEEPDSSDDDESEQEEESAEESDSEAITDEDEGIITGRIIDVPVPVQTTPLPPLLLLDPAFPLLPFLRAYRDSDSMRARQWRWELIKQFDVLFTNYRRDGWERDEFCPPGTTWASDGQTVRCQCPAGPSS
ncbi:hypothetical protein C8Q73DRAFT_789106 [Cubamyces lactineus]|nr:hypothetical protein C8Q73DRAFT_789106 [Cubamyces lactineus]